MDTPVTCLRITTISGICIFLLINSICAQNIQDDKCVEVFLNKGSVLEPNTTAFFNCTFTFKEQVYYVNYIDSVGDIIFARDYVSGEENPGSKYNNMVKVNERDRQWLAIDFIIPFCFDGKIKCEVATELTVSPKYCRERYAIGVPLRNVGLYYENGNKIEKFKQDELKQDITCKALDIAPNVTSYNISSGCTEKGDPISKYNATTCLYDWSLKMNCKGATNNVECLMFNGIGKHGNASNIINAASTTGGLAWLIIMIMVLAQVIEET